MYSVTACHTSHPYGGTSGQFGGKQCDCAQSTTNFSSKALRPKSNGYLTVERSLRFTLMRNTFDPMQSSISTTGLRSRKSAPRISCHPITGRCNRKPLYCSGNLNSALSFLIVRSRASREDAAAPVSMRAGSLTPHGIRITSSTSPMAIFFPAVTVPAGRRRTRAKINYSIGSPFRSFFFDLSSSLKGLMRLAA